MAHGYGRDEISNSLVFGLIIFLVCFVVGLAYWDWHHDREISKNIAHHSAKFQAEFGVNGAAFEGGQIQWAVDRQMVSAQPWWGINIQTVNAKNKNQVGSPVPFGVVVIRADSGSIVDGLVGGDVIVQVDGRLVRDDHMFWSLVKDKERGDEVELTVFRNGERLDLHLFLKTNMTRGFPVAAVNPATKPPAQPFVRGNTEQQAQNGILREFEPGARQVEFLGMGIEEITPELAQVHNIPVFQEGLVVTETDGAARFAGLLAGDVIVEINSRPVKKIADLVQAVNQADPQTGVNLGVFRRGEILPVRLKG